MAKNNEKLEQVFLPEVGYHIEEAYTLGDLARDLADTDGGFTMKAIARAHSCCGCYCDHMPACPPCDCAFHNPNVL